MPAQMQHLQTSRTPVELQAYMIKLWSFPTNMILLLENGAYGSLEVKNSEYE